MATKKPTGHASDGSSPSGWLPKLRGSATDQKARAAEDAAQGKGIGVSVISKQLRGFFTRRSGLRWEHLNG